MLTLGSDGRDRTAGIGRPGSDGRAVSDKPAVVSVAMLCPNCMSPYVEPLEPEADAEAAPAPDEPILRCTECEYSAPRSEFVPENYR